MRNIARAVNNNSLKLPYKTCKVKRDLSPKKSFQKAAVIKKMKNFFDTLTTFQFSSSRISNKHNNAKNKII